MWGPSRKGYVVHKPVDHLTLRAEDSEALLVRVHLRTVPRADAETVAWVIRMHLITSRWTHVGRHASPSPFRAIEPIACVSRKSSHARRAIMPRWAVSPVLVSRRSIERSRRARSATGSRRLLIVEGGPGGRPAFFRGRGSS